MGTLRGYARVSTEEQHIDAQTEELQAHSCEVLYQEHRSGADRDRPELARLLKEIRPGDVLVVVRLDRLARSVSHLLAIIETLKGRGAHFRSLRDPIDTTTPQGMLALQILGAIAEFERALIADRVKDGMKSAKARGRISGNPGVRAGDPDAIAKLVASRDFTHVRKLIDSMESFMPTVRRMRPDQSWPQVVKALNALGGRPWTVDRLRRNVSRLVAEGLADKALLGRAARRRHRRSDELALLVRGIALANPDMSLRAICRQLEAMKTATPAGNATWSAASVAHLLAKVPPI